jgi:hypothetical protein
MLAVPGSEACLWPEAKAVLQNCFALYFVVLSFFLPVLTL